MGGPIMSEFSALARKIARLLTEFADRAEAAEARAPTGQRLPPIAENAYAQRQVAELLQTAPDGGLSVSVISERTEITKENVYEKLKKLAKLGWTEEVPDTWPTRWRLTVAARR
jgi:predicted Rossmann fold nucleotide-binding protein DprA/Smf involved in DNA uptake